MPAFPDLRAPLGDGTVELRFAVERDIPEVLIAHQDDPRMAAALGLRRPPSGAELGRRAEQSAAARAAGREAWLTVVAPGRDECRGQLDIGEVDWENRRVALTIWIAPRERRRGLGSSALALAGRWLLADCGLERVALSADPGDAALRGAAARAGFRSEGVLRARRLGREGRHDVESFSLVVADLGD